MGPSWLAMVEVTGRRTGKTVSFPAVIADYDNGRHRASMPGEAPSGYATFARPEGALSCATVFRVTAAKEAARP
jgi:hypothetical protein